MPEPARLPAVRIAGVVTGLVLVAWVAAWLVDAGVNPLPDSAITFIHVNLEANLPTWWSAAMLLAVAGLAAGAVLLDEPRTRPAWLLVAAATVYFSLDEASGVHELLAYLVPRPDSGFSPFLWLIPGSLLAAAGVVVLVLVGRRLPPRPGRGLAAALGVYLIGALGVELVNGRLRDAFGIESAPFVLGTVLEEGLEMAACVLALGVLTSHLRALSGPQGTASALRAALPGTAPRVVPAVVFGGWLILCLVCVVTLLVLTGDPSHPVEDLFDIRGESAVPMWWQSSALLLVAGTAGIAAAVETDRSSRRAWRSVAVGSGLFSLAEAAVLHERLGDTPLALALDLPTTAWVVPGAVVALVTVGLLRRLGRPLPGPARRQWGIAVALLLGAAVLGQGIVGWMRELELYWAVFPLTLVEETIEVTAICLALHAVLQHLVSSGPVADRPSGSPGESSSGGQE